MLKPYGHSADPCRGVCSHFCFPGACITQYCLWAHFHAFLLTHLAVIFVFCVTLFENCFTPLSTCIIMFKGDNWHISLFGTKFNICFYSDIFTARFFKLCMIIIFLEVYTVVLGLMTLTLFQGHICVRNINCRLCVWIVLCSLNIVWLLHTLKRLCTIWFIWLVCIQGR